MSSKYEQLVLTHCLLPFAKPILALVSKDEVATLKRNKYVTDSKVISLLISVENDMNDL